MKQNKRRDDAFYINYISQSGVFVCGLVSKTAMKIEREQKWNTSV